MKHKYGDFSSSQMFTTKKRIRSEIFHVLLIADPETKKQEYETDVKKVITDLLYKIGGLNSVLSEPAELVSTICFLEEAKLIYKEDGYTPEEFKISAFRKLILDAGAEIMKVKEV